MFSKKPATPKADPKAKAKAAAAAPKAEPKPAPKAEPPKAASPKAEPKAPATPAKAKRAPPEPPKGRPVSPRPKVEVDVQSPGAAAYYRQMYNDENLRRHLLEQARKAGGKQTPGVIGVAHASPPAMHKAAQFLHPIRSNPQTILDALAQDVQKETLAADDAERAAESAEAELARVLAAMVGLAAQLYNDCGELTRDRVVAALEEHVTPVKDMDDRLAGLQRQMAYGPLPPPPGDGLLELDLQTSQNARMVRMKTQDDVEALQSQLTAA